VTKKKIKVVQLGLGPVGCGIAKLMLQKSCLEIVGAIDLVFAGKDLGVVAGLGQNLGIIVSENANEVFKKTMPDIVVQATGSFLKKVYPQLETAVRAGINVVSTCEELSYPYRSQPVLSAQLDNLAKEHNVSILSTGVNPGFLMDAWPLAMTAVCQDVQEIRATRIQDAKPRRLPFQKKIGAGKTVAEFNQLVKEGTLRHMGLPESIAMIASAMKWELDDIKETIEPVIAQMRVQSAFLSVEPGQVSGVKQTGRGIKDGKDIIVLEFQAYLGAEDSFDAVSIIGTPNIETVIKGGTHGDLATIAMIVNAIPRVVDGKAGLLTMKDMPLVYTLMGNT